MKIVIDGRFWSESGLGRYTRNLIYELQKIDTQNEYFILLLKKDFSEVNFNNNFHKVIADFKWYGISEQLKLPKLLNDLKPDLVHFSHFNVPILYRGKFVVTIHDLIHHHFKTREATTRNFLLYKIKQISFKKVFSFAVKKSVNIITPSEFIETQLINEWGINQSKIIVTLEGVDSSIFDLSKQIKEGDFAKVALKFKIKKPYIFYVGNAQPHKNINRLIKAFEQVKNKFPEYSLVLSGPDNYFWQQIEKENKISGLIFTGHVSERELITLYKNATMFAMPSLEEGFGIPILEAMACDCPVVCSNAGSLPEVGGDAALYFDPKNEEDMVQKFSQVLSDQKLRKELIKKGEKRYKEFSWKKLAQQTLEVYLQS